MQHKTIIITAFEPEDFFIGELAKAYTNAIVEAGASVEILSVNTMRFANVINPKEYDYDGLQPDLQQSVDAIKSANSLAIFINYKRGMNPALEQFISRIFHLKANAVNNEIWGKDRVHDRKVRIISVIDDEATWEAFKQKKDPSILPTHKINFRLFGFGFLATANYGYLRDNTINDYALKQLEKVRKFATDDLVDPIDDLLNG